MQTRIWICPSLCGCELEITANWATDPVMRVTNGVNETTSFQHPIPFTISTINILNICPTHQGLETTELSDDPYSGAQGYIKLDHKFSEAETLYTHLYEEKGMRYRKIDTCGCQPYICGKVGAMQSKGHPILSKRCEYHLNDTDHTEALGENRLKNQVIGKIKEELPELTENEVVDGAVTGKKFVEGLEPKWSFNELRELEIELDPSVAAKEAALLIELKKLGEKVKIK